MADSVVWRDADKSDCEAFKAFECANPPKARANPSNGYRIEHPRMWEYEAQRLIHGLSGEIPSRGPSRTMVALDSIGLAAVVHWTELDGPSHVQIEVAGLALRLRFQQRRLTHSIARATMRSIEENALQGGHSSMRVQGEIFHRNGHSQRLAAEFGLTVVATHPSLAETWGRTFLL